MKVITLYWFKRNIYLFEWLKENEIDRLKQQCWKRLASTWAIYTVNCSGHSFNTWVSMLWLDWILAWVCGSTLYCKDRHVWWSFKKSNHTRKWPVHMLYGLPCVWKMKISPNPFLSCSMHLFFETCHAQFKGWSQCLATPIRASGAVAKEFMYAGRLYFLAS